MRFSILAGFCALVFGAFFVPQANAAPGPVYAIGGACSPIGKTVMATDNKNILSCVCNTTANCTGAADLKWKAQTTGTFLEGTYDCGAGYALTGIVNGVKQCILLPVLNYTCPAGQAIIGFVNGVPQCAAWTW